MLKVQNLKVQFGDLTIVEDINFTVNEGDWLMLVGPNSAGKSTIVKAIAQSIDYSGNVFFKGQDVSKIPPIKRAQSIGVLSQNHFVGYSFSVEEVVRLGRYAYSSGLFSSTPDDEDERVQNAMKATGITKMADQSVLTLSGGELQRTFLAQIIAQDPKLMILDEPTNHLDLIYQQQVFELISKWIKQSGRAVISVVHDLSLAQAYGTKAVLLNHGKIVSAGDLDTVLTRDRLKEVYSIDVYKWMQKMLSQWT